jgi:hypothetical protein
VETGRVIEPDQALAIIDDVVEGKLAFAVARLAGEIDSPDYPRVKKVTPLR